MNHSVFFCSDELAAIERTIGLIPATICCFRTVRVAALATGKLEAWRVIAGVAAECRCRATAAADLEMEWLENMENQLVRVLEPFAANS